MNAVAFACTSIGEGILFAFIFGALQETWDEDEDEDQRVRSLVA